VLFMTVPTAGAHPELLDDLIHGCGLPLEQIVVVSTRPGVRLPPDVVVVEDFGPLNIQRWWLRGIEEAVARGATAVAVCNDDLILGSTALAELHEALVATGATVASPSRPPRKDGVHRRPLVPYSPRIWGCLWVLDATSGLRPDPRYVWWYGDNDLDIRARRDHRGIVTVPVDYEHRHPGEGTGKSSDLSAQTDKDALTFQNDYGRILMFSRWVNKARGVFGLPPAPG
jgi:hypothetical protein